MTKIARLVLDKPQILHNSIAFWKVQTLSSLSLFLYLSLNMGADGPLEVSSVISQLSFSLKKWGKNEKC